MTRVGYAAKRDAVGAERELPDGSTVVPRAAVAGSAEPRSSFAQEQFWYVDQLSPGTVAYNFSWPTRLRGRLDVDALRAAFAEIVRRHEALRTGFSAESGDLVQVIGDPDAFALQVVDLSDDPDPQEAALGLVDVEGRRPFDLGSPGLFRVQLVRLADDDHVLQIVVHHVVFDEWSKVVLYRELGALYDAFAAQQPSPLAEPRRQYADFAEWQRRRIDGELLERELAHWTAELAGAPTVLELPADRPRPPVATLRGARLRLPLPAAVTEAAEELAREQGASFFDVLAGAFQLLLQRYSGEEDFVVGVPADNRTQPELDGTIGVLLNTIVLRSDLAGNPSFRDLVGRVARRVTTAAEHAELPFELLVRELQPERDLSRHPLFQVLLAINPPDPTLQLSGIVAEGLETETVAAGVDLFLFVQERDGGYDAIWEYSTDLFDRETAEQMHGHLVRLLEAAVAAPDDPVDALPMLAADERAALLEVSRGPDVDYPDLRLHRLVEEQVQRSPTAVAVAGDDGELTYEQLDRRANVLARRLRSLGVERGSVVAVALERSLDLVVALLAVLKAGGAYLPLDPDLPAERASFMLDDSRARVLVTREATLRQLPPFAGATVCVDTDADDAEGDPLDVPVGPEDTAYVIYTSGSTGTPKGVLNTHRGIVNRLLAMQDTYRLGPTDRLLQKTQTSFDVAVREVFWPLIVGARLVLATPGRHGDPVYLADTIEREQLTIIHFVPSLLQLFVDEVDPARFRSLRCVLSGGEALPRGLVTRFMERFDCELHNLYGPTEAAVSVTSWRCRPDDPSPVAPLGRPVANTQLYVVDRRGELAPVGVWGELLIAGVQVAAGYLDRPELDAERFLANPFGEGRAYRTGDLARWTRDGVLEFRGRIDDQVKVRGFRIELGEIEAALRRQPAVADCAVVVVESGGPAELAAYVVSAQGEDSRAELQAGLRSTLPEYMVPASLTFLERLPLLPSGKLDRAALPAPDRVSEVAFEAPATEPERAVAGLWSELLEVERVGRNDNFFTLGGHSLLAARLVGRVSKQFAVEVPLCSFLQEPTVAALATRLAADEPERAPVPQLPPLVRRSGVRGASFAQERFWFVDQVTGSSAAYNIPVTLRLRGGLDIDVLRRALSEIVRRHEILRTHFSSDEYRPVQVIEPPQPVALEVVDLSSEGMAGAQAFIDRQARAGFELTQGPLFRAHLVRLAPDDHVLNLVFNHLVFDGWSKLVVFRELGALYDAFLQGGGSPLPEPALQFADFAEWERSWLEGELLERELQHWTSSLAGMPDALELPTDRPRPPIASMEGAWLRTTIPSEIVAGLQELARREGATFYTALLAAFDVLLHRYSGQGDIAVGMPVDARDRVELEEAVGVFVDTVVLRVELSGALTFRDLLQRVRGRVLDAIAHQRLPFEQLVRALAPDRQLARHPLYQVMLTLVPFEAPPSLHGLVVEELAAARATSPIDLTVFMEERGERWDAVWEYSTDLFDRTTIERMQAHFVSLLEAIVDDPDRRIGELQMLSEDERERALARVESPDEAYPVACLHELFERRARERPEAPALTFEGETLAYGELNRRANRLARILRGHGVGPETRVALCLERSLDLVVAILAVLKAGGGYVPLDPDYPADRLAFVLDDAAPTVVITHEKLLSRLPADATTVCVDRDATTIAAESDADLEPLATPESLAYVIYTSGSTGRPKGVQVEHRQVARLLSATDDWFGFGPADTWLLFHSYAFDFSVWELWGALAYGGRLVVAPLWTTRSPQALASLVVDERVTVLNATPTLFLSAQDDLVGRADELALRTVVFGGEALRPSALRPWYARFGEAGPTLVNMYGITETTVHVTYRPLSATDVETDVSPIGVPIPDLQLYLLDEHLMPVPAGVVGELFVGGAGVARGYLNRPELNAERFLDNPFAPGRLYRSGDTARYRDDGELEFLGRVDDQVKIRGFRIELGEIQAALEAHDGVAESAVVPFSDDGGETRLAAYLVPAQASAGPVRRLAALLRDGEVELRDLPDAAGTVVTAPGADAAQPSDRGFSVPDGACVVDAAAGIGLFALLVDRLATGVRVLCVEADQGQRDALAANVELHGLDAIAVTGPDRSLSQLLRDHGLETVDLLRVANGDALHGIGEADWPRVRQVVVEAGDEAVELLERHGFAVTVDGATAFATRGGVVPGTPRAEPRWRSLELLRDDVRTQLESTLPAFMVPSSLSVLPSLPLTINGKLDRKALPAPDWEGQARSSFVAPRTPVETTIAEIWREILGIERVGADDNFFHLGGHSLLAARVVTQVRERFEMSLSVRALFEHPTLALFAEHVAATKGDTGDAAGGAAPAAEPTTYPPSFAQQQLLVIDELAADIATYNGAFAARIDGDLSHADLAAAFAAVVERHEPLRTVFRWTDDGPVQVVLDDARAELSLVDLSQLPAAGREDELERQVREELRRPFDLATDILVRATLFGLDERSHVLLVVTHHIASDGWSVGVFCRDLSEIYNARRAGRAPQLPELSRRYRDFVLWQRERLTGRTLEDEIAYWRTQLAGAPTIARLPTTRRRPERQTFEGASLPVHLPAELADDVRRLARETETTPYQLLLAVFGLLLYRRTGQDDILVGSPFANRNRSEFDDLVGFFANTLVLRLRLAGNPTFRDLLGRVADTVLGALDHQEFPFERLVEALRPQRDPGVNPLVQVNCRIGVEPPATLDLTGARSVNVPLDPGFAAFDLALDVRVLDDGIAGELIYHTELFDRSSVELLALDYEVLLRQVLEQPDARLLGLSLPSEEAAARTPAAQAPIRRR